jgi:hypothetical protein
MPNGDKCDDVHNSGEQKCQPDTGSLVADVITYREGTKKVNQAALDSVSIKVNGPTKTANQTTGADGSTPVVSGLDVGTYDLTLQPTATQSDQYDFAGSIVHISKAVAKNKSTPYHFVVPYHWVEHQVQYADLKTFITGIDFVLRLKKPADAAFAQYNTGTTASSKTAVEKVPAGQYKLDLKLVYNPVWGAKEVVIGTAIDLKATVSGFDDGAAGNFEIYDSQSLSASLLTVASTVTEDDTHQRQLKTSWTPTKDNLQNLKSGSIVFRAVMGTSATWSAPLHVFIKETYQVVDQTGTNLDTPIKLVTSAGQLIETASSGGQVDIKRQWNDVVTRIDLPKQKGTRVTFEDDGAAARAFAIPK